MIFYGFFQNYVKITDYQNCNKKIYIFTDLTINPFIMKKITLLMALVFSSGLMFGQTVLTEDFENDITFPTSTGWTVEDLAAPPNGEVWTIDNTGEAGGFTPGNTLVYDSGGIGNYATMDSDGYGNNGTAENTTLTSPVFDCSTLTSVTLSFDTVYNGNFGGQGTIEVFNGTSWTTIQTYATAGGGTPNTTLTGTQTFDVPELVGVSNAQIRFRFTGNWSISWSIDNISVFQCTVNAPNAVTAAVTPLDGATDVNITYTTPRVVGPFEWENAPIGFPADSFTFNLGETPAGNDIGSIEGFTNGTSINFNWEPNTTYYWSIDAVNCAGTTPGPIWSFTTADCAGVLPTAPNTPIPNNGAVDVALDVDNGVIFNWTAADPNDVFTLNIGLANPPDISFDDFENGGTVTGFDPNTTYFWSVDITNCFGTTQGPVWSFTTGETLSVNQVQGDLFAAYPNPTNDKLTIKTSLEIDQIDVFNLLGQNVKSFKNSDIINDTIDLSNLNQGMYLIKIYSGEQTKSIKITKE
jgi:hypothetical protein